MGLPLGSTVNDRIIGITREGTLRMSPPYPDIKCVVHEQVHQKRTDHSSLRSSETAAFQLSFFRKSGSFEPAFQIEDRPFQFHVFMHGTHEEVVVDMIKGSFDIELDHPVVFPTSLSRDGHCLLG